MRRMKKGREKGKGGEREVGRKRQGPAFRLGLLRAVGMKKETSASHLAGDIGWGFGIWRNFCSFVE